MIDRLKRRHGHRKVKIPDALTDDKKKKYKEALDREQEVASAVEIGAIVDVVNSLNNDARKSKAANLLSDLMNDSQLSDDEKNSLIEKIMNQQKELDEKYQNMKDYSNAALMAKLEARRKLREEKNKEDAMRSQLEGFADKKVIYYFFISHLTPTTIWDKAFKNGLRKFFGRQPLKDLKGYGLFKLTISLQMF